MGIKMDLGSSDSQASSVGSVSKSRLEAYQSAITALSQFSAANSLQGSAYDSGKSYGQSVLTPLIQGAILYSEGLGQAVSQLPSKYRSEVGEESLDENQLTAEITAYEGSLASLRGLYRLLERDEDVSPSTLRGVSDRMDNLRTQIRTAQEKLNKLRAFAAGSNSVFTDLPAVVDAMNAGIAQIQTQFANFTGQFSIPSSDQLTWTKTISKEWEKREERYLSNTYKSAIQKFQNGEELTEEEIAAIILHAKNNSNISLSEGEAKLVLAVGLSEAGVGSKDIGNYLEEIWRYMVEHANITDITYETIMSSLEQIAENPSTTSTVVAKVSGKLNSIINNIATQADDFFSMNTNFGRLHYATSVVDDVATSGSVAIANTASGLNSITNFISRNANAIKLFGLGFDFTMQVSSGESVANASIKTAAHSVIGTVAGKAGAAAGAWIGGSALGAKIGAVLGTFIPIPGVGTIAGAVVGAGVGFAIGVGLTYVGSLAFDAIYDTYVGKHVDNAVKKTQEFFSDVGDSVSSWFGGLGSAVKGSG